LIDKVRGAKRVKYSAAQFATKSQQERVAHACQKVRAVIDDLAKRICVLRRWVWVRASTGG
jgi:hypothetical protein